VGLETAFIVSAWTNWSGRLTASPSRIVSVASEAEVVEAVRLADREGLRVHTVGAAHSHSRLAVTDGLLLDPSALRGVLRADPERREASLAAGTRIADCGEGLREYGLALRNQGDIDRQAIAGAVATGTHGTGPGLQNLSASVVGTRLVLASGEVVDCSAEALPELFTASRLSLGAFGVATEVRLALRDAYRLEERMWLEDLDAVLDRIDELTTATRHFEFFWSPGRSRAACKSLDETQAQPVYPLAEEGGRLAWSYEVLANERNDKHSEMEYSLPAAHGPACMRAIRDLVHRDFEGLAWPVEYRTLAADDVWLSTAYGRPTVTISVHQGVDHDDEPLFRACEEIFLSFDGRPHWGKVHYRSGDALAAMHDRWSDWWRVRDQFDPDGRFLNELLEGVRPG
jgi:FAD/FMN-containing dehydrogenase